MIRQNPRVSPSVSGLALVAALSALPVVHAAPKGAVPTMTPDAIVIATETCRYAIGTDGTNRAFVNLAEPRDYAVTGQPAMVVCQKGKPRGSTKAALAGSSLVLSFGDTGVEVRATVDIRPRYFTVTVESVRGADVDWLQFCNLPLSITESVGTLVNAAWDDRFAVCALAGNDRTHSYGAAETRAVLQAKCYREFGFEGAKVAVIAVPTAPPDPGSRLLDAIETVELEQGLPHPMLNGVWIKRAPERFASYLMVSGIGEANVDQVIDFARGGFGCVEIYPWRSTPSYGLNPAQFPHGMAGLKTVADKVHAAGMQLGIHCMQGMVGWGAKDDPYISPKADPRLLQDRHATLATALDPKATEIALKEGTAGWPEKGDLYLDGEIVQYTKLTETGFAACQRGLYGTTVVAHPAGTPVGHLVNCFPIWGHTVYCPDIKTDLIEEICARLASVFNDVGADMSYFDGGEEVNVQPPHWRHQGRVALGVQSRLRKPVILEGNALYTNLSWHVITRGSPHFDPIYFGRRIYTLRLKGQNPARWARNLLTGDVGWFHPHVRSLTTDAVTPDEVLLLCLKALGGNAPISFSMSADNPWQNRRMPEMLEIIRACDDLKRRTYFTGEVCAELARPMAEHTLECTPTGEWLVRPLQFGPPRTVAADRRDAGTWSYANPFGAQTPWVRVRAQTQLAPYGAKENIVLADFAGALPFKVADSASPDLVQSVEPAGEKTPDGASAFCYRAENRAKTTSDWCRISCDLPKPLDLSTHRRLGLWLRREGTGGILNVQIAATDARRDHYVPLASTGWTYVVLDTPEDRRFYDYKWPYSFTDLMYTCQPVYSSAKALHLYFNGLPPGAKTACWIGRIEALAETPLPLQSPALDAGGREIVFPVSLKPDEYLEMDWSGRCRHFEPNGGLLGEVEPTGALRLTPGENAIRFTGLASAATSPRAEVTLAVRGSPLANEASPATARRRQPDDAARYASFATAGPAAPNALRPVPDGRGGCRLLQGVYERVANDPVQSIAAFDGTANVWTLENPHRQPRAAGVLLTREADDADFGNPQGRLLETFADAAPYAMSDANQFEKYVIGGGKEFHAGGPVRSGVTHHFAPRAAGGRTGPACGVYIATNQGAPGGWCAKGRRFTPVLDLSSFARLALWVHGDAKGQALKVQFRDVAGRYADWVIPIGFSGWRLQTFAMANAGDLDWTKVEYVIFYYNNLPTTTCELRLDTLKALPQPRPAPVLHRPVLTLNGRRIKLPDVGPGEALTVDGAGRIGLWRPGTDQGVFSAAKGGGLVLQPGSNRVELTCDTVKGALAGVTVRVMPR